MSTLKDTGCRPQSHGSSKPGGGPCPSCGRPRCSAAAKSRPGERCRKNPHPGASICTNHGLTVAGRAAAERRQTETAAAKVLDGLWVRDAVPVTNAVAGLQQLAGQLQHVADFLGGRLEAGGLDQVMTAAWLRVLRELRTALGEMERLGIAERAVEIEGARVRLMAIAFGKALDALGVELTVEQLARARAVLLAELRSAPELPVGPGPEGGEAA